MTSQEYTARIDRIFRESRPEDICMFIAARALTNKMLGYVLIDRFGRYATDDARSLVQQCFLSPQAAPAYHISTLDWRQIDRNLGQLMAHARDLHAQGDDLQAAAIARHIVLATYQEYRDDHPSFATAAKSAPATNPAPVTSPAPATSRTLEDEPSASTTDYHTGEALELLRAILIDGTRLPHKQRRAILVDFIGEAKRIQRKDWFCPLTQFIEDAQLIVRTPKGYIGHLRRKIASLPEAERPPYIDKLQSFLLAQDPPRA